MKGKTILVTGASSGIGRAIAIHCAARGARVVLTARREEALQETLRSLEGKGHQYLCADLTKSGELEALAAQAPEFDGIVHCAGMSERVPVKLISKDHIERLMGLNFTAPVLLQTELLKKRKVKKGASVVFIASRAASYPSPGNAIYSASKGALISYAKGLGLELAGQKIRVNCICPAMVWTDLITGQGLDEAELHEAEKRYPLKRFGEPADVANLAVFLLSDESAWMTGSCIDLTGGGEGTLI